MKIPPFTTRAPLALLFLALGACSDGGDDGPDENSAVIQGKVSVPASSAIFESEPNDLPAQAQNVGSIYAGQTLQMIGSVSGSDIDDFFQVSAPNRVEITATLTFDDSTGNEFDIGIFDPIAGDVVEAFLGTSSPATGTFHARGTFLPFVEDFAGAGSYTLTLSAAAPADPIAEREPNGQHDEAQYLGTIVDQDHVVLSGDAKAAGDVNDRFVFAVPADIDLAASLTMPGGADFDIIYTDVTDVLLPSEIIRFDSLNNPETGTSPINALTMVEVAVEAAAGTGVYTLTLDATAADDSVAASSPWRRASLRRDLRGRVEARTWFESPGYECLPGEVIVLPRESVDLSPELARRGLSVEARIPGDAMLCTYPTTDNVAPETARRRSLAVVASLQACESVVYAEPNILRHATSLQRLGTAPNDPRFDDQWHYKQILLPAAWAITQGDNAIRIGVIDTGRLDHPDLVARLVDGFDFISSATVAGDGNGVDLDETDVGDAQGPQPSSFHGTHVAGTIGADTDNGAGVAGVTWFGQIMHLRVLGIGGGSTFDITNAVRHAAGLSSTAQPLIPPLAQPLDVINMSLGGPGFSQSFQNACTAAHNAGVVVVAAAGNENSTVPFFPASFNNVISVAAVDITAKRAFYSNHNADVDLAAPGGDVTKDQNGDGFPDGVLSTHADDSVLPLAFTFDFLMGTSMASPHVAGVAALILAADPTLTPDEVESILTSTATDLGTPGRDDSFGHGLINAFQAVLAASGTVPGSPVLGLSTQSLSFGAGVTALDVQVTNVGGGLLLVGTPVATTDTGGPWLAAARVPIAPPTNSDTSAIAVTVDRTGLADGVFTGNVNVPSNGGALDIQVALIVDSTPVPPNVEIFVLAVKSGNFATVEVDSVNPAGSLKYTLATLPEGSYLIFAGSDDDGDFVIGGPGDRYFGAFPTLAQPSVLEMEDGETLPKVNFAVETDFQGDGPALFPAGLRRPRSPGSH